MKTLTPLQNTLYRLGAVLMLIGAGTFLFSHLWACVMYVVGIALFASMQYVAGYEGHNIVIQRLRRQQLFGLVCLVVSAVAMALNTYDIIQGSFSFRYVHHNEWVIFLAIGALLQLYTAFRIPSELEKEAKH